MVGNVLCEVAGDTGNWVVVVEGVRVVVMKSGFVKHLGMKVLKQSHLTGVSWFRAGMSRVVVWLFRFWTVMVTAYLVMVLSTRPLCLVSMNQVN